MGVFTLTVAATALKVAVSVPNGTVTDTGTANAPFVVERATAVPLAGAIPEIVTVQLLVAPDATVVGLQDKAVTDAGGGGTELALRNADIWAR